jgi:hypothetical protein
MADSMGTVGASADRVNVRADYIDETNRRVSLFIELIGEAIGPIPAPILRRPNRGSRLERLA